MTTNQADVSSENIIHIKKPKKGEWRIFVQCENTEATLTSMVPTNFSFYKIIVYYS